MTCLLLLFELLFGFACVEVRVPDDLFAEDDAFVVEDLPTDIVVFALVVFVEDLVFYEVVVHKVAAPGHSLVPEELLRPVEDAHHEHRGPNQVFHSWDLRRVGRADLDLESPRALRVQVHEEVLQDLVELVALRRPHVDHLPFEFWSRDPTLVQRLVHFEGYFQLDGLQEEALRVGDHYLGNLHLLHASWRWRVLVLFAKLISNRGCSLLSRYCSLGRT